LYLSCNTYCRRCWCVGWIPRIIINEHYLIQGHNLKTNAAGELLYTFSGCTNVIRLPNPDLRLYKCQQLTFDLETTEEARRKSISGRVIRKLHLVPSSHSRRRMWGTIPAGTNPRNWHRYRVGKRPTMLLGKWNTMAQLLRLQRLTSTGPGPTFRRGARLHQHMPQRTGDLAR
jgi:hypothetical protein